MSEPCTVQHWIDCYCWFYRYLRESDRTAFNGLLHKFLDSANFVGVGIEITDEIRVAVGGWAVLLVLNRPLGLSWYSNVERISIYAGSRVSDRALAEMTSGYFYTQVRLAWDDVRDSATKATEEDNSILHEFAHVLDHGDRKVNGIPSLLLTKQEKEMWQETFQPKYILNRSPAEVAKLWKLFGLGAWSPENPDDYTSINMGELFAVATEMFFESPAKLHRAVPELYDNMVMLYRINPGKEFLCKQTFGTIIRRVKLAFTRQVR